MLHTAIAIRCAYQFVTEELYRYLKLPSDHLHEDVPQEQRSPVGGFFPSDSESDDELQVTAEDVPETLEVPQIASRVRTSSVTSSGFWSSASSEPDQSRDKGANQQSIVTDAPDELFGKLFTEEGEFDFDFLEECTRGKTLVEVTSWCDVDHYNLLEKAVIYNSRRLVKFLLKLDRRKSKSKSRFSFMDNSAPNFEDTVHCFRGAIHLAAFLGCVDIVEEFLNHNPALSVLRGAVHIRPLNGPASDLFRLIGYTDFTKNPRLAFQMNWVRTHPNERPVHYAICGGYPLIMTMLMGDTIGGTRGSANNSESACLEKDALLANLLRQAASCASFSCLATLFNEIPQAIYTRDQRGWLYISGGLPHGFQFVKFLIERGFAVKLLNNIDGRNTVNALHVFYSSLSKIDGVTAKFTDLYDVTDLLLDLGVDVNMETTAFHSHGVSDTPLHILIDHINFIVSAVIADDTVPNCTRDGKLLSDTQTIYDDAVRDTVYLILENGYDIERHCYSLLKRLFMNRNFLKRYKKCKKERYLSVASYGLRTIFNIARLILDAAEIRLNPARREVTPALYLIDTLRDQSGIRCIFGDINTTQTFNKCLKLLFENGDNANIYPFFSSEDSYLASPMLHLCDLYIDHWCHRDADVDLAKTLDGFLETLNTMCASGANFTCYMSTRGNFYKHGVFDSFRKMFVSVHRNLRNTDQSVNVQRLRVMNAISGLLVKNGAEPRLQEYAFRKAQLPMNDNELESNVLGQVLLLGLYSTANAPHLPGRDLVQCEEYLTAFKFHLHLSNHTQFYTCINRVIVMSRDLEVFENTDEQVEFSSTLSQMTQNVRTLRHISRLRIYNLIRLHLPKALQCLPFPDFMIRYMVNFER